MPASPMESPDVKAVISVLSPINGSTQSLVGVVATYVACEVYPNPWSYIHVRAGLNFD